MTAGANKAIPLKSKTIHKTYKHIINNLLKYLFVTRDSNPFWELRTGAISLRPG